MQHMKTSIDHQLLKTTSLISFIINVIAKTVIDCQQSQIECNSLKSIMKMKVHNSGASAVQYHHVANDMGELICLAWTAFMLCYIRTKENSN